MNGVAPVLPGFLDGSHEEAVRQLRVTVEEVRGALRVQHRGSIGLVGLSPSSAVRTSWRISSKPSRQISVRR